MTCTVSKFWPKGTFFTLRRPESSRFGVRVDVLLRTPSPRDGNPTEENGKGVFPGHSECPVVTFNWGLSECLCKACSSVGIRFGWQGSEVPKLPGDAWCPSSQFLAVAQALVRLLWVWAKLAQIWEMSFHGVRLWFPSALV